MSLSNFPIKTSLESNIKKGKTGEEIAKIDYAMNGFIVIPTGIGSDFIAKKPETRKLHEYVEVKTGKSRPTKRQRMVMRLVKRAGHRYTIYRVTDVYLESYLNSKDMKMEVYPRNEM